LHPDLHSFPTRRSSDLGIRVADLFDEAGFRAALERNVREKNAYLQALLGETPLAFDDILARYWGYRDRLRPFVADTGAELRAALDRKSTRLDSSHRPIS